MCFIDSRQYCLTNVVVYLGSCAFGAFLDGLRRQLALSSVNLGVEARLGQVCLVFKVFSVVFVTHVKGPHWLHSVYANVYHQHNA